MSVASAIVIGAGAAGLHAARLLRRGGAEVSVLEAADRVGGRVRSLEGFAPAPVELGAEELHGEHSRSYRLAREAGVALRESRERAHLWSDLCAGRRAELRDDDPDAARAWEFFDALPAYEGEDVPLSEAIASLPARTREVLDAVLGNEYGASSERLGLRALARAESAWDREGFRNYVLKGRPLVTLLQTDAPSALLGRRVATIDWRGPAVAVTTRGGERFTAEQVVVTVPLPVLRDGDIEFIPRLPEEKVNAARGIGVGPVLKVILRFKRDLWPQGRRNFSVMGAPHAPQVWSMGRRGHAPDRVLTAFVGGRAAEALLGLGARALPTLLADLDRALSTDGERAASRSLEDHVIQDWGAEPFIRGGFSYPTAGSTPLRSALAAPLYRPGARRPAVVFAGEATHERLFGSLQGALLSAGRAVTELHTEVMP